MFAGVELELQHRKPRVCLEGRIVEAATDLRGTFELSAGLGQRALRTEQRRLVRQDGGDQPRRLEGGEGCTGRLDSFQRGIDVPGISQHECMDADGFGLHLDVTEALGDAANRLEALSRLSHSGLAVLILARDVHAPVCEPLEIRCS